MQVTTTRTDRMAEVTSSYEPQLPLPVSFIEKKKYQIIYADPPWQFTGLGSKGIRSGKMREDKPDLHRTIKLEEKYPTMKVDELKLLPVNDIADENSVLFLWTTDAHLPYAIEIMRSWGFEYATVAFVWNKKEKSGKQVCYYGYWTMKGTEVCLLGRRGKVKPLGHNIRQLVEAARNGHSTKPAEVRDRIVALMGDLPRIELFARPWPNRKKYAYILHKRMKPNETTR